MPWIEPCKRTDILIRQSTAGHFRSQTAVESWWQRRRGGHRIFVEFREVSSRFMYISLCFININLTAFHCHSSVASYRVVEMRFCIELLVLRLKVEICSHNSSAACLFVQDRINIHQLPPSSLVYVWTKFKIWCTYNNQTFIYLCWRRGWESCGGLLWSVGDYVSRRSEASLVITSVVLGIWYKRLRDGLRGSIGWQKCTKLGYCRRHIHYCSCRLDVLYLFLSVLTSSKGNECKWQEPMARVWET